MLICLTRLTNHPDIPKQQLPAITSNRTHVPISCTAISSLALDLGQISALGCSRARCSIQDPGNWMEHPLAVGQEGSSLPVLFCTYPSLPFASTQGWQLLPPQVPVLGGKSQPETGKHVRCTQESSNVSSHPTQVARLPKNLNSILAEGSTRDLGDLWQYETDQVGVPESVQEAAPRFSHFSSHFRGDLFFSHSPRAGPQHWVEPSLEHVSDMALLLTNHPESLPAGLAAERTCLLGTSHMLSL